MISIAGTVRISPLADIEGFMRGSQFVIGERAVIDSLQRIALPGIIAE